MASIGIVSVLLCRGQERSRSCFLTGTVVLRIGAPANAATAATADATDVLANASTAATAGIAAAG